MTEQSLKEKTAKGLFWGGLSNGVQQLLNLFFGIFLSRILNAEDYAWWECCPSSPLLQALCRKAGSRPP